MAAVKDMNPYDTQVAPATAPAPTAPTQAAAPTPAAAPAPAAPAPAAAPAAPSPTMSGADYDSWFKKAFRTTPDGILLGNDMGAGAPLNSGPGLVSSAMPTSPLQSYTPTKSVVDKGTETVQGQVNSILATDSPLMERARTLAAQRMNGRGLINSSMNTEAGVAAMTDRAMEMGSKDAEIYGNRSMFNANNANQGGMFNAGQNNDLVRQQESAKAQQTLQTNQQQFATIQSSLDREHQAAMQKLTDSLNQGSISKTFAANTSTGILNAINSVQLDPNLTPEAKKGAIANIIAAGNSTMQWGSAFYSTPLPPVKMPGAA